MIANDKVQPCLTRRLLLLLFAAASILPVFPAMAHQRPQLSSSPKSQETEDSKPLRTQIDIDSETTLEEGVERLNAQVRRVSERLPQIAELARDQPPLTADEVVASIRSWDTKRDPIDPQLLAVFQEIAESRKLPAGADLSFVTSWKPNSEVEFTVWWIDISVSAPHPEKEGSRVGYAFRIRDRRISSRLTSDKVVSETLPPSGTARQQYIAQHYESFVDTNTGQ